MEVWRAYGWPQTWRQFRYGVNHLGRAGARDALNMYEAVLAANATEEDRKRWAHLARHRAGL